MNVVHKERVRKNELCTPDKRVNELLSEDDDDQYEHIFLRFSSLVEQAIKKIVVSFIILLIFIQILMQYSFIRQHLSRVEQLEGTIIDLNAHEKG